MEVMDLLLTFQFNTRLESFIAKFKTAECAAGNDVTPANKSGSRKDRENLIILYVRGVYKVRNIMYIINHVRGNKSIP